MSDFYQEMQNVASEVIGEFIQGNIEYVPLIASTTGTPDNPGKSTDGTPIPLSAVAKGVSFKFIDNTNIVATDLQITLSGDISFEPDMKSAITVDGVRHKIVGIKKSPAAGVTVAYHIIFRK